MLPLALTELCVKVDGDRCLPRYFGERDRPWIAALLEQYAVFQGEKRARLRQHLREPLAVTAPLVKWRVLRHLLEQLCRDRVSSALAPREARWLVFRAAAENDLPRGAVLESVATATRLSPEEVEAALFADLDGEKLVSALPFGREPDHYIGYANRIILASLFARAVELRVMARHDAPALVRKARSLGLICAVRCEQGSANPENSDPLAAAVLEISGPLALFRRTQVYARCLAALLPAVLRCASFRLEADCRFVGIADAPPLFVSSDDPLDAPELDSAPSSDPLLTRFGRDFAAKVHDWELIESRSAWVVNGSVLCPDFELLQRERPERRWFLQIVRSWTLRSLQRELARANTLPLLLCVDEQGASEQHEIALPDLSGRVLFYKKRLDPERLISRIQALDAEPLV